MNAANATQTPPELPANDGARDALPDDLRRYSNDKRRNQACHDALREMAEDDGTLNQLMPAYRRLLGRAP